MPLEYEYNFYGYDKKKLIKTMKQNGGKKFGTFIFRIMVFKNPSDETVYIRVRDEGFKITMTTKKKDKKSGFDEENEVIVNDFNTAVNILLSVGCVKKFYYEKIREIWRFDNTEVFFNTIPATPDFMEIESSTKKELDLMVKKLDLNSAIKLDISSNLMKNKFGITDLKNIDLTFDNVKKQLSKRVTKNKSEFLKLIIEQKELYDSLK